MAGTPRGFRATLSEELPKWTEEGLVSADSARLLRDRYRLEEDGTAYAALAVYFLGALLIGGGVISFIAWNWSYLPDAGKLVCGVTALIATQVVGYRLAIIERRNVWLGQGLLVLGVLLFGANLGLVSQVFNVSGHWRFGLAAWALVGAAMTWTTQSHLCAAVTAFLVVAWAFGQADATPEFAAVIAYGVAILIGLMAARFRNPALLAIAAVALTALLCFASNVDPRHTDPYALFYVMLAVTAMLLSGALSQHWASVTLRRLGVGGFVVLGYLASFATLADELELTGVPNDSLLGLGLLILPLLGTTVGAVLMRLRVPRALAVPEQSAAIALGGAVLIGASAGGGAPLLWLAAHVALVVFVAVSIRRAIYGLERASFWLGVVVGGILILTRFLEFETGLLFKAAVFTSLGVTIMGVGYAFESRRREVVTHANA